MYHSACLLVYYEPPSPALSSIVIPLGTFFSSSDLSVLRSFCDRALNIDCLCECDRLVTPSRANRS